MNDRIFEDTQDNLGTKWLFWYTFIRCPLTIVAMIVILLQLITDSTIDIPYGVNIFLIFFYIANIFFHGLLIKWLAERSPKAYYGVFVNNILEIFMGSLVVPVYNFRYFKKRKHLFGIGKSKDKQPRSPIPTDSIAKTNDNIQNEPSTGREKKEDCSIENETPDKKQKFVINKKRIITVASVCVLCSLLLISIIFNIKLSNDNSKVESQLSNKKESSIVQEVGSALPTGPQRFDKYATKENYYHLMGELTTAIDRNPGPMNGTEVILQGFIVRSIGSANETVYLLETKESDKKDGLSLVDFYRNSEKGTIFVIEFKNDTYNRALTGDYVFLKGTISNTTKKPYTISNATYEMITPVK